MHKRTPVKDEQTIINSELFESQFVHTVYNCIADHFDKTRQIPWSQVTDFLNNSNYLKLSSNTKLLDAGCGNGKYIKYLTEILKFDGTILGVDNSENLLNIAKNNTKSYQNIQFMLGNLLNLKLESDYFDTIISIAVLHHFSTKNRRQKALDELVRCLKPGGWIFCTVWGNANDNTDSTNSDYFIPWHNNQNKNDIVYQRYYHLFNNNELLNLALENKLLSVKSCYYSNNNLYLLAQKLLR